MLALLRATPKITAKRIGAVLRQQYDPDLRVSERSLREYVAECRTELSPKEPFVRISYAPGYQAQFDFSPMSARIAGEVIRLQLFVMRLSYSGHFYARASHRQDQPALFTGLLSALASYKRLSESASDPITYLGNVMSSEIERRHENRIKSRIAGVHFPALKTFDNFDFAAQQSIPKVKLLEFTDGQFVREHRNLVFYGPPGVGKTHCLLAIGLAVCMKGYRTFYNGGGALDDAPRRET